MRNKSLERKGNIEVEIFSNGGLPNAVVSAASAGLGIGNHKPARKKVLDMFFAVSVSTWKIFKKTSGFPIYSLEFPR